MKYKNQNSTLPARAYPNTPLFESALNIAGALANIKKQTAKACYEGEILCACAFEIKCVWTEKQM